MSDGAERWVDALTYDDCTYDVPSVAVSPGDSTVYVTCVDTYGCNAFFGGYLTAASDAASGSVVWQSGNAGYDSGSSGAPVAASADGNTVFQTRTSGKAGNYPAQDYQTMAWTVDGSGQWSRRYDGPAGEMDVPTAMTISPDGSELLVTGWSVGRSSGRDFETIAYGA